MTCIELIPDSDAATIANHTVTRMQGRSFIVVKGGDVDKVCELLDKEPLIACYYVSEYCDDSKAK